jgi:hypothetical protein
LTGRIFDQHGSPIAGVQVTYNDRKSAITVTGATDRLGVFRLRDVPAEKLLFGLHKKGHKGASAMIPADAWEVEMTMPSQPPAPE